MFFEGGFTMDENQKVVLTGIKPSGDLTLGNYTG